MEIGGHGQDMGGFGTDGTEWSAKVRNGRSDEQGTVLDNPGSSARDRDHGSILAESDIDRHDIAHRRLQEDTWFLVIEPVAKQDRDHYEYYCADTKQHVIAWFDVFDASLLFQECGLARLELEAQFWKHVDFFPRHYKMRPSDANELQAHLEWFLADSRFIFGWNRAESHLSSNNLMTEQGVAFCGFWIRSSSIFKLLRFTGSSFDVVSLRRRLQAKAISPPLLETAAMFRVPTLVLEHIENIHVDDIVNLLDIRQFVDRFNDDNVKHSTLVSLLNTSVKR
ncbi:hypothetical protein DFJ58DRAFT_837773 [Suillus subalutaceus]|uniref:uncharacterized protein n=1 Tax=Suillus subalutaceus TaxID=48586 RepID=UPI001B86C4D8|nr:uncharacterized protein DFJ58DRAFT_837773 [Suillus subalutaceus]KAG1868934.1 hypothetical protein DFJ58DRAFT_837773 [Suillus subalutaceus]